MQSKTSENSKTTTTDIVLPGDTNSINNLFGGELLARMDKVASISAKRHAEQIVVTSVINNVIFSKPIPSASVLILEAKVSRAFGTSMEVFIDVWVESLEQQVLTKVNEAIFTFVAVDIKGKPVKVPQLKPESELEIKRYNGALRRRQLSLVLAGKLSPNEATELKALFEQK